MNCPKVQAVPEPLHEPFLELLNPDARKYAAAAALTPFEARLASTLYDMLARLGIRPSERPQHQIVIDTAVLCRRIAEQQAPAIAPPDQKEPLALLDLNPASRVGVPLDLVRVSEMAKIAGISVNGIYQRIRSGRLKSYGADRLYRVSLSELLPLRDAAQRRPGQFPPGVSQVKLHRQKLAAASGSAPAQPKRSGRRSRISGTV